MWVGVGCVDCTPTGNPSDPPSTSFSRTEPLRPSGVRLRSARSARLHSASPRKGEAEWKKTKLQTEIYTDWDIGDGGVCVFQTGTILRNSGEGAVAIHGGSGGVRDTFHCNARFILIKEFHQQNRQSSCPRLVYRHQCENLFYNRRSQT